MILYSGPLSAVNLYGQDKRTVPLSGNRPSVWERVNERFDEAAAAGVFSGALEMMETVNQVNAEAYRRNGERWAEDGSGNGSGGSGGSAGSGSASSQTQEEAARSLITWLEGRIANLDRLINERAGE